jgi:hypothetical protein
LQRLQALAQPGLDAASGQTQQHQEQQHQSGGDKRQQQPDQGFGHALLSRPRKRLLSRRTGLKAGGPD